MWQLQNYGSNTVDSLAIDNNVLGIVYSTYVARDTSCGLLDLSGTRRSAWL